MVVNAGPAITADAEAGFVLKLALCDIIWSYSACVKLRIGRTGMAAPIVEAITWTEPVGPEVWLNLRPAENLSYSRKC